MPARSRQQYARRRHDEPLFDIYDSRTMDSPTQRREISLRYRIRSLACMPDGQGAWLHVDLHVFLDNSFGKFVDRCRLRNSTSTPPLVAHGKIYVFKCRRYTIDDVYHVWPVDALAFHPMSVLVPICIFTPSIASLSHNHIHPHPYLPIFAHHFDPTISHPSLSCIYHHTTTNLRPQLQRLQRLPLSG